MTTTPSITRIKADIDQTMDLFTLIRDGKTEIASLRRRKLHLTAAIQRDELLSLIEAWLDPDGMTQRAAVQREQGASAAAAALDIDPTCGF